jgi:uncharacterized damage-inducible protein DinB
MKPFPMDTNELAIVERLRKDVRSGFEKYLPSIVRCLQSLNEKEIWWRPNKASNAAGNIILHLCGNVRQWIVSGLGGAQDVRVREKEFSERGPVPRQMLITQLKTTVGQACEVIDRLTAEKLLQEYRIQGYRVSGLTAILHVYEHFAYHAGQITYLTKLTHGKDLRFTRLPNKKAAASQSRKQHP